MVKQDLCRRALLCATVAAAALGATVATAQTEAGAAASAPTADSAEGPGAGEIIVTARRRAELLQDIPVSVSVVSANALRERNIVFPQDLATITPGLQANPAGALRTGSSFSIRGQGAPAAGTGGSGVASYLAEVPEFGGGGTFPASAVPPTVEIFDIANVQVLKGPQGTLFGRVTTGGAVLFQPNGPTEDFEGYVNVRLGSWERRDVDFAAGGPIIDGILGLRVAGVRRFNKGFAYNLYTKSRLEGANNEAYRATAKLTLGNFNTSLLYQYAHNSDPQKAAVHGVLMKQPIIDRPIPRPIANLYPGLVCNPNCPTWYQVELQEQQAQAGRDRDHVNINAIGADYETARQGFISTTNFEASDWLTFRNIASWRKIDYTKAGLASAEASALPITDLYILPFKGTRTVTEEFQIQAEPMDTLQLTAGIYYEHAKDAEYARTIVDTVGGYPSSVIAPTAASTPAQVAAYNNCAANPANDVSSGYCHIYSGYSTRFARNAGTDKAAYVQAVWEIVPKLRLTAGYRRTKSNRTNWAGPSRTSVQLRALGLPSEIIQIPGSLPDLVGANPGKTIAGVVPTKTSNEVGTYNFAVDYKVSDDVLIYATTRTGFKPGGFNNVAPAGLEQFGPEKVTDYEIGAKTRWRIGGVSGIFNATAFRDSYSDIQRTQFALVNNVQTSFTQNVAKARIQGIDFEGSARFSPAFDLTAFYSYLDAKFLEWPNTGQGLPAVPLSFDYATNRMTNTPKHTFGFTPSFHLRGVNESYPDITLSGNLYHQSSYAFIDLNANIQPENIIEPRTIVNFRADWKKVNDTPLSLGLSVTNAFNYRGRIGGNNQRFQVGHGYSIYHVPRSVYVDIRYEF